MMKQQVQFSVRRKGLIHSSAAILAGSLLLSAVSAATYFGLIPVRAPGALSNAGAAAGRQAVPPEDGRIENPAGSAQPQQLPATPPPETGAPPAAKDQQNLKAGDILVLLHAKDNGEYEVWVNGQRLEGQTGEQFGSMLRGWGQPRGMRPSGANHDQGNAGNAAAPPTGMSSNNGNGAAAPPQLDVDGEMDGLGMDMAMRQRFPLGAWGGGWGGDWPQMTDELAGKILDVMKDIDPTQYERWSDFKQKDPDGMKQRLGQESMRWLPYVELKKSDPDTYQLTVQDRSMSRQTFDLVRQIKAARKSNDAKTADGLQSRLQDLVEKHFDVRQKMREHDLTQLEQRLNQLRVQVKERADKRKEIVDAYMTQIMGSDWPGF